jgi:hypothetical protein
VTQSIVTSESTVISAVEVQTSNQVDLEEVKTPSKRVSEVSSTNSTPSTPDAKRKSFFQTLLENVDAGASKVASALSFKMMSGSSESRLEKPEYNILALEFFTETRQWTSGDWWSRLIDTLKASHPSFNSENFFSLLSQNHGTLTTESLRKYFAESGADLTDAEFQAVSASVNANDSTATLSLFKYLGKIVSIVGTKAFISEVLPKSSTYSEVETMEFTVSLTDSSAGVLRTNTNVPLIGGFPFVPRVQCSKAIQHLRIH